MKILAIETSCDETAVCLLECTGELPHPKFKILGNSLISQIDIHKDYGGVYPMLAKREHQKNLPILLERTLKEAGFENEMSKIDYVAVTRGPGLEPALWTGITFAEELARKWKKPLIPVNHMEGHIWSVLFHRSTPLEFPLLALLVSGGHTELVRVTSFKDFEVIGTTRDDAVGEAFDKAARLLGLSYPGGARLSALAKTHREKGVESHIEFPRPMLHSSDFDFSYSGLKTAVLYKLRELGSITDEQKEEIARAFEDAAIDVLVTKTRRALETFDVRGLIVGGGVAGNTHLQSSLKKVGDETGIEILFPLRELTTDNAVMIGIAAYIKALRSEDSKAEFQSESTDLKAEGNLAF